MSEVDKSNLKFPLILKPSIGSRSIGVEKIYNLEELKEKSRQRKDFIIQELIGSEADEYTCTIVKIKDKISEVLILRRYLRSGDTYKAEPVKSKIISKYVKDIAKSLNIYGPCNFQLRLDNNGRPKVFEINCRFSGTTPFCAQLGFNPLEYILKISKKCLIIIKSIMIFKY